MGKLRRSINERVFSGVCGGIGEYFNIDPTIVRIVWILLSLRSFGTSLIIYLVCTIIIPEGDGVIYSEDYDSEKYEKLRKNTPILIGLGLIIWGAISLANIVFPWFHIRISHLWNYWPVLLIVLGLFIIFNQRDR
ncbi:MAG: PspC domain-containing protein [Tissierellia bacterium]|nr:PspC domain-containing protein [Tissierellia bacterium]